MIDDRDQKRYDRQIRLIGSDGQERLKSAKVFIAGAGGLGSPISFYLAAAGVGKIVLIDKDEVELSNLNRQILHWEKDLGSKKALSGREKLESLNSDIEVDALPIALDESNASDLIGDSTLIIDAMDNFSTRYLLNRIALQKNVPFIHGAISGFQGQVTTILPGKTACLRCIFPKSPPPSTFPVIGVTPGIIGLIQATEALKYIIGMGELLAGKLLLWDGLTSTIETIDLEKHSCCPDCGEMN